MNGRILAVDDEPNLRELLRIVLEGEGYSVRTAASYAEGTQLLTHEQFDLVICDIFLPDEYLSKPFDVEELKLVVAKQLVRPTEKPEIPGFYQFIGQAKAMWAILERVPQVARSDATVLITGESGTGKELLARAIHAASPRSARLFVPINCGALPEGLLESELFGHVRGSFTGAVRDKRGLMQEANGGTLFLDEIGELSPNTQVKLLRALQEKRVRAVGDNREVEIDARVIAATNQDLLRQVKEGRFREDFYYRINVIHLHVPPLRERTEDVPQLVRHFVARACNRLGVPAKQVHRDAMALLESYSWPGNVRELENFVERTAAMEPTALITASSLPPSILGSEARRRQSDPDTLLPEEGLDLEAHLDSVRRELMVAALARCGGVQKKAAQLLRLSYRAFRYHAEKFNLVMEE